MSDSYSQGYDSGRGFRSAGPPTVYDQAVGSPTVYDQGTETPPASTYRPMSVREARLNRQEQQTNKSQQFGHGGLGLHNDAWAKLPNATGQILAGVSADYDWRNYTAKPINRASGFSRSVIGNSFDQGRPGVPTPAPVMAPDQPGPTSNQGGMVRPGNDSYLNNVRQVKEPMGELSSYPALGTGQSVMGQTQLGAGQNGLPKGSQFAQFPQAPSQLALNPGPAAVRPMFADTSSPSPGTFFPKPGNMGASA